MNPAEGAGDGSAFVRAARASDAAALARIQVESWRDGLSGLVPDDVLEQLTSDEASAEWESRWTEAIASPPTSRHRVFVAVTRASDSPAPSGTAASGTAASGTAAGTPTMGHRGGDDPSDGPSWGPGAGAGTGPGAGAGAGAGAGRLSPVGFASAGPATDPDRWPATDGQLNELRVLPEHAAAGHASRLLHAVADTLAEDGFHTLSTWVLEADSPFREFLTAAGLEPDGARGELDMGKPLVVLRYATLIGGNGGERA